MRAPAPNPGHRPLVRVGRGERNRRSRRRVEGWAVSAFEEEREGPRRPRRRPVRNSVAHRGQKLTFPAHRSPARTPVSAVTVCAQPATKRQNTGTPTRPTFTDLAPTQAQPPSPKGYEKMRL